MKIRSFVNLNTCILFKDGPAWLESVPLRFVWLWVWYHWIAKVNSKSVVALLGLSRSGQFCGEGHWVDNKLLSSSTESSSEEARQLKKLTGVGKRVSGQSVGSYIGTRGTTRIRNLRGRGDIVNVIIIYVHRVRLKFKNTFIRFPSQFGITKLRTYCYSNKSNFLVGVKVMNNFWKWRVWGVALKFYLYSPFKQHVILNASGKMIKGGNYNPSSQFNVNSPNKHF